MLGQETLYGKSKKLGALELDLWADKCAKRRVTDERVYIIGRRCGGVSENE